jgi:hypothetical protein
MNLAAEDLIHDDPSYADDEHDEHGEHHVDGANVDGATAAIDPGVRLAGTDIFRGLLVIVTALIIGGFVISRGIGNSPDGNGADPSGPAATETSTDGDATGSVDGADAGVAGESATADTADGAEGLTVTDGSITDGSSGDGTGVGQSGTADDVEVEVVPEAAPPAELRPPSEVKVLVLNAAQRQGVAGRGTELLASNNYVTGAPKNADQTGSPSVVLYADGYQGEALAVADVFAPGLEAIIQPLDPAAPPIGDTQGANVIVVIGPDGVIPIS